jgi:hypothetical protein
LFTTTVTITTAGNVTNTIAAGQSYIKDRSALRAIRKTVANPSYAEVVLMSMRMHDLLRQNNSLRWKSAAAQLKMASEGKEVSNEAIRAKAVEAFILEGKSLQELAPKVPLGGWPKRPPTVAPFLVSPAPPTCDNSEAGLLAQRDEVRARRSAFQRQLTETAAAKARKAWLDAALEDKPSGEHISSGF